jgi:hypothetical protein
MARRFLCLGAFLLLIVLGVAACGGGSSGKARTEKTVPDPDAGAKPSPAGKGG